MSSNETRTATNPPFKSRSIMCPLPPLRANHGTRINDIINNRDATGRIAKWAIELLPFDITYKPR